MCIYVSTEDETKSDGIQITENPHNCPQMNSMIMFSAHRRASPDSSRWGPDCLIIKIKGSEGGFVPVLASLGIQEKLSSPQKDQQRKKGCFCVLPAQFSCACLGGSLLTFSAFNTSNNRYHYNCFSFTPQSSPHYKSTMGRCDEHPCPSVSCLPAPWCEYPENVEPSSGKTILFYCTGTKMC